MKTLTYTSSKIILGGRARTFNASTDSEEQMASYDAQVSEYRKKINENPEWSMVEIYSDAGISGTSVKHRTQFKLKSK